MKRYINTALSIIAGISLISCVEDLVTPQTDMTPEGFMTLEFAVQVPDMETQVQSLGQEDPLEESKSTHSSILS